MHTHVFEIHACLYLNGCREHLLLPLLLARCSYRWEKMPKMAARAKIFPAHVQAYTNMKKEVRPTHVVRLIVCLRIQSLPGKLKRKGARKRSKERKGKERNKKQSSKYCEQRLACGYDQAARLRIR